MWFVGHDSLTLPTNIGLLPCVCPLVSDEDRLLTEVLPTLPENVGLLPCVCPLVGDEVEVLTEALPTLPTNIGLLPCVCPLVITATVSVLQHLVHRLITTV